MASSSTWADTADVASRIFAREQAAWGDGREVGGRRRPAPSPRVPRSPPEGSAPHSRRRSASPPPPAAPSRRRRAAPPAPTLRSRSGPSGARRRAIPGVQPRAAAAPPRPCPARLSRAGRASRPSAAHGTPGPAPAERRRAADGWQRPQSPPRSAALGAVVLAATGRGGLDPRQGAQARRG